MVGRTGPTLLEPSLYVFPKRDPVEFLPDFSKGLVDSKNEHQSLMYLSKYSLGSNDRNHQQ